MERRGVGMVGAALVALWAAGGCDLEMGGDAPPELVELPLISMNSLRWEDLAANLPATRGLLNAPLRQSPSVAALVDRPGGLQVLQYAVTCALAAGDRISVANSAGDVFALEGRLGVNRGWPQARPTTREVECTAGCMAAHLNGLGKQVAISVRGDECGYTTEPAERIYNFEEGAFAVDPELQIYTCTGRNLVQQCGRAAADALEDRACTRGHPGCGQIVECGECRSICKGWSPEGGYTDCSCNGARLAMTTTFLEDGATYSCDG